MPELRRGSAMSGAALASDVRQQTDHDPTKTTVHSVALTRDLAHSDATVAQLNVDGDFMTTQCSPAGPTLDSDRLKVDAQAPLRAVHTTNFPALLRQLGASLLVTTYQAGKLVLVRDEGDHLNTHFRTFQAPMGMAYSGDRLAVGTKIQVWEYVDVPAVDRQARAARPARRLLSAPLQPRHGQHPDP